MRAWFLVLVVALTTLSSTEAQLAVVNSTQRITSNAVITGNVAGNSSLSTTPLVPYATPGATWNTSLLCKHLANITAPHGRAPHPTEESIEAKCFPGFVCVNGYCTGGMSCKCFEGWAGLFCQSQCPSNCTPEGTCVTSTSNQAICVCNDTSDYVPGVGCVFNPFSNPTTTAEPTTTIDPNLRSRSERECFGSIECLHGYCDIGSMQCICDLGWRGQLCNEPCDLKCGTHGRCRENSEYIMICVCDAGYSGDSCQNDPNTNTSSTESPSSNQQAAAQEEDVNSMWYSKDSESLPLPRNPTTSTAPPVTTTASTDTTVSDAMTSTATNASETLRPMSERQCMPGYVCKYGYCHRDNGLSCFCDSGYGGAFCDEPCHLDCGASGSCVSSAGKVFCRCLAGFDGTPCAPVNTSNVNVSTNNVDNMADLSQQSPSQNRKSLKDVNVSSIYDPWEELDGYGPLRPLALRACAPGFVCRYGNCTTDPDVIECICDDSFTDVFCNQPCLLDCGPRGKCEVNKDTNTEDCYCWDSQFTGPNCTETRQDETQEQFPLVGVAVALTLLFLTLIVLVLLPYYLWRKRNITMMSLVHWFQPFEEDDGRQYDAFVSYASADLDRQFVIQTLVPKLEGRMCFTLCIHQRNFVPGLFITDNITESVKKSRRTLLIISPAYISSSWCKFEYQMALQEMLTEKHRILPIILGDVSHLADETDETLKTILKSVTWLEYPGKDADNQEQERFWKRLALSLPKKRPGHSEPATSPTCLISPSVNSSKTDSAKPLDTKAPLELRSFKHKGLRGVPFHQIVRVPAEDLASTSSSLSTTLCTKLSRLLGRSGEDDLESQDVTSSQSPLDPYYVPPPKSDPAQLGYAPEVNQVNHTKANENQLPEVKPSEKAALPEPWPKSKEFDSKDMSALDNYLGDPTLARQLAV